MADSADARVETSSARAAPPGGAPALSQSALEAWGRALGEAAGAGTLRLPLVIALRGELGAGKSVLARAIARGAGVESPMPSPTYNLLFTYEVGPRVVHHLDLYRLEDPEDVWELGWEELGRGDEIVLIEWPERAESLLPPDRWDLRLTAVPNRPGLRSLGLDRLGDAPPPPDPSAGDASTGRGA